MMPSNTAAWLVGVDKPLEVKEAPYPSAGENEVVVESRAVALNFCDWAMQKMDPAIFPWLRFPAVVGEDVAGDVVAVGPGVAGFKVGDRVAGFTLSAFQRFAVLRDHMASAIPDALGYEQACVVPAALTTAVMGLFHRDYLALRLPSLAAPRPRPAGAVALLIWGGSTSVGSNAIQLAAAAGYEVYTTASPRNFDYVRALGASHVFDHNSPTVSDDVAGALRGRAAAGALAIGGIAPAQYQAIVDACAAAVAGTEGKQFVALTMRPPERLPAGGVGTKFVNCMDLAGETELGYAIYRDYLPQALSAGSFTAAPPAEVVGAGLESIQAGLERLPAGVSAKKLVIGL